MRYNNHNELAELPLPSSMAASKSAASAVYEDIGHGQLNARGGMAMGTLYDQVSDSSLRRLPPPPSYPALENTAEPLYEGLSQYSGDADGEADPCGTMDTNYGGLRQCSAIGDAVVEVTPCQDTVDYEVMRQESSSSGDVVTEANPCCDTADPVN